MPAFRRLLVVAILTTVTALVSYGAPAEAERPFHVCTVADPCVVR